MIPGIVISTGDPNGIGPEIVIRLLTKIRPDRVCVIIAGRADVLESYSGKNGIQCPEYSIAGEDDLFENPGFYLVSPTRNAPGTPSSPAESGNHSDTGSTAGLAEINSFTPRPGLIDAVAGKIAMQCVELGIRLCLSGRAHALVTAPISKEAIRLAGYVVPGHTEFLAQKTGTEHVLMMMVSETMRVALATAHLPIRDVAVALNSALLQKKLELLNQSLTDNFGIRSPRIAVLGLNPHAGDGGVIGREELDCILPAMQQAGEIGISTDGPFPADAFFARKLFSNYDAVLAMYHDQGLIPFKSTDGGSGINFTAGLPIIRTSPDHGTAFDIAGTGSADVASMKAAFDLAFKLAGTAKARFK